MSTPPPEKKVDDTEFTSIAQDPASGRFLRETIERLAKDNGNSAPKEMAEEVLSGRVSLREAIAIPAYAEAVTQGMQPFREEWDKISESERESLAAQGESDLAQVERQMMDERKAAGDRQGKQRHDGKGWSLY